MEDREILLSFCIPTYKRKKRVIECINEIQKIQDGRIEIMICDNHSEDGTREAILELQLKDKRINYIENQENIGAVANISKVLSEGNGKYLYLISDEDFINIEFILKLLNEKILENEKYNIILGSVYDIVKNKYYQKYTTRYEKNISEVGIKILTEKNYMSGIIFKKNKINFNILNKYEKENANLYPNILALLTMIIEGELKVFSENICFMRNEEKTTATQKLGNNEIKYWSPKGRIEQLKFMNMFIQNEIQSSKVQKILYKIYAQKYSVMHNGDLFKGNFMGADYRNQKKYFYNEVIKIEKIKNYFILYNYINSGKNILKKILPNSVINYLKKIKRGY
ncbi:glycosyltransferase family 2 protein [Fusobacterium varium]|uniref:Glycosyltransferase family 2 protein n=2 Tax=Fusobacterium varium TaxID=856 RepID=A0ABM6U0L4_FUSVA|nr:glycosyltransferase family 2 protein [Fusobacterium varium]AVQ29833.1 glycosyltransferase family 2 protein [Fusobacterium varium ATCC 27725]EES65124.1 glycosyltransferase, group 2 family protein [Fusobacterium varium ATCC 27725]VEH38315.1 N-glycosyltransferase [Fusobacterium varium]